MYDSKLYDIRATAEIQSVVLVIGSILLASTPFHNAKNYFDSIDMFTFDA